VGSRRGESNVDGVLLCCGLVVSVLSVSMLTEIGQTGTCCALTSLSNFDSPHNSIGLHHILHLM